MHRFSTVDTQVDDVVQNLGERERNEQQSIG